MKMSELIAAVAAKHPELSVRQVEAAVKAVFEAVTSTLENGGRVELRDFGAFTVRRRDPKQGRNPKTGEPVAVAAKWTPFFKAGAKLRKRVDNGSAGP